MNSVFEKIIEKLEEKARFYNSASDVDQNIRYGVIIAKEIVQEEAAEYNNGWIPCSERLPKEYGDYLVAWRPLSMSAEDIMKKVGREVSHFYEIVEYDPDDEALWIGSIEQAQGEYEIIAWQPLPQPFQKGE